ncbi:MAG: SNF2-related protein [Myxococcota bacterium]|nr:SNF2-related protein [Myxococcota bacterium]
MSKEAIATLMRAESPAHLLRAAARAGLGPQALDRPLRELLDDPMLPAALRRTLEDPYEPLARTPLRSLLSDDRTWRLATSKLNLSSRKGLVRCCGAFLAGFLVSALTEGAPPVVDLPSERRQLVSWAESRGILDALLVPISAIEGELTGAGVRDALRSIPRRQTILVEDVVAPTYLHQPPGQRLIRAAVVGWLLREAQHVIDAEAEEPRLLALPLPGPAPLAEIAQRLLELRARLRPLAKPTPMAVISQSRSSFRAEPLNFQYEDPRTGGYDSAVSVRISFDSERRPRIFCDCELMETEETEACRHQVAAVDAALALLRADRPETAALAAELALPAWGRTLQLLTRATDPEVSQGQIIWTFHFDPWMTRLAPLLQRPLKRGGYTKGTAIQPEELAVHTGAFVKEADRTAARLLADGAAATEALCALAGKVPVYLVTDRTTPLELVVGPVTLRCLPVGDSLRLVPSVNGHALPDDCLQRASRSAHTLIHVDRDAHRCLVGRLRADVWSALGVLASRGAVFPAQAVEAVVDTLERVGLPSELPPELMGMEVPPQPGLTFAVTVDGTGGLTAELRIRPLPGALPLPPGEGPEVVRATQEGQRRYCRREFDAERALATATWARAFPDAPEDGFSTVLQGEAALDSLGRLEQLSTEGVEVIWPPKRPRVRGKVLPRDLRVEVSEGRDWFGLSGEATLDAGRLDLALLLQAARSKERYVRVDDETWVELSEELRAALAPVAEAAEDSPQGPQLSRVAGALLQPLEEQVRELAACDSFRALSQRLRTARDLVPVLPGSLTASLRPYQRAGFDWLTRLAQWSPGACLADDMGLGKTLQALSFLVSRQQLGPQLVVAPTSLGFNWEREAQKFAPTLRVQLYHRADREAVLAALGPGDLLVVSYGLLLRDTKRFASRTFATLVLDEAQAVKNASTRRARAVRELQADFRLALTGTPLENHLGELWSLFRVVVPGLLGSEAQFRERHWLPIERNKDPQKRRSLSRLLQPFLLRRTKAEVASELPAKTEAVREVTLSPPERALYEEARLAAVAELEGRDGGPPEERRFKVLAALTRLRLLACHPGLHDKQWSGPTSKLDALLELVDSLREEGHQALVFSQFTQHLGKVREALDARGLRYLYLDGQTPEAERQRRVERFQAGEADLFLLSTKAGGVGLNLTAANYVIHLDPWWNPAVEDQATDRAHRIGQGRAVTVYRLVARGTIEESILALHGEKRALIAGILDGTGVAGRLETEQLAALLERSIAGSVDEAALEEDLEEEGLPSPLGFSTQLTPSQPGDPELRAALQAFRGYLGELAQEGKLGSGTVDAYPRPIERFLKFISESGLGPRLLEGGFDGLSADYLARLAAGTIPFAPTSDRKAARSALAKFSAFLTRDRPGWIAADSRPKEAR